MPKLLETAPRILLHAVVWLLVTAAKCFGVEPDIKVNAPEHILVGQILDLSFDKSIGSNLRFKVSVEPEIKGLVQFKHNSPEATSATIATFPGRWRIRVQAYNADGIDEWERIIQLPGEPPTPQPGPDIDPPGPVPPEPNPPAPNPPTPPDAVPVGEFGIAPKVAASLKASLPAADRPAATKLAESIEGIAAQIAAGTLTDAVVLLEQIDAALKATGSDALRAEWKKNTGPEVNALLKNPRLALVKESIASIYATKFKDASGWSTLMREVAVGVRAGAK